MTESYENLEAQKEAILAKGKERVRNIVKNVLADAAEEIIRLIENPSTPGADVGGEQPKEV